MYEEFLMSEACSLYYSTGWDDDDAEAQDFSLYINLLNHATLCKKAANTCKEYLKTKNKMKLLIDLNNLGFYENVKIINKLKEN